MRDGEIIRDADEVFRRSETLLEMDEAREAELERLADEYLAACGAIKDGTRGSRNDAEVYTEQQIRDKCGRDWHVRFSMLASRCDKLELEYMTMKDVRDFRYFCRMSDRQYAVLELWLYGLRQVEIAQALNESASYVKHTISRCASKILDKWQSMPWYGIWTVYYEMVWRR